MNIQTDTLKQALELMVFGMGGVFIVLFIIYVISQLLIKIFPVKK
ncbi:MAG: OadG family protein [Lactobacillales bacterium]|nr:OadG family protein [Lactobacillales bacterium]